MALRDHLVEYRVTQFGYTRCALAPRFVVMWLEHLPPPRRALLDIALWELVTHGIAVSDTYAKPITGQARPRNEGMLMWELRHDDHPDFAIRMFCGVFATSATTHDVVVFQGADKHAYPGGGHAFYERWASRVDIAIDQYLEERP